MNRDIPDVLRKICETKRSEISSLRQRSEDAFYAEIEQQSSPRGFKSALRARSEVALIAEVKKASPSAGIIRENFSPVELARAYEDGGARCLSVLTDREYFKGDVKYLKEARDAVHIPVLRKDFILDEYQILEARSVGADCVLLIVSALEDDRLAELRELAQELEMDTLVEVHNEHELETALSVGADLIGINNRDLHTFEVDLDTTVGLMPRLPDDVVCVAESGIRSRADVRRMKENGVDAVLVGESLMRADSVEEAAKELSDV